MTTITTARQIFYSYPKLPVDAPMPEYVSLEEYEALKVEIEMLRNAIALSAINSHNLKELLYKWAEKTNDGLIDDLWNSMRSPELEQLITATKAALDAQPGNNLSTSRQSN